MKRALLIAPMATTHKIFNTANIDALLKLGYEVHLAANFDINTAGKEYAEECKKNNIIVHNLEFFRAVNSKNVKIIAKLKKLISDNNYDIIHAHTETGGLLFRLAMKKKRTYKAIYTPHGMSFYKGSSVLSQAVYRPAEKWICSAMDANIAMNNEEYAVLEKWNKSTACYVHGIGLDLGKFRDKPDRAQVREKLGINDEAVIITAVGELNKNKNHRVIIEALSKLKNRNAYMFICGVGDLQNELEEMIRSHGLENRVKLLGYRNDIKDILYASDIFAFPSYHEGLPVSVMEAMCTGLPVVCSDIRGNNDLIQPKKGGYLCNPDSSDEFCKAFAELIADETMRRKMGAYNANIIEAYGRENVAAELGEVYV